MSETTSSRLLTLLSLLQGRRDWPGSELADRLEVSRPHDPPRRRAAARARLSGRVDDRPGRRLPAARRAPRCRRCCSTTTRRSRSPSACAPPRARRSPGSRRRRCARSSSSSRSCRRTCAAACSALQNATIDAARPRRPDGRPAVPDRRSPRPAATTSACASPTPRATRPARRREVEPHSLVNAGRRWYLVAWDCGREDWRTFRVDRITRPASTGVRFEPRKLPGGGRRRVRAGRACSAAHLPLRGARHAARARRRGARSAAGSAARSSRSTTSAACSARATTTSTGWRCASRCSASTSRCTARPSWSSGCARSASGSSGE